MAQEGTRSLKALNFKWLCALAALDVVILVPLVFVQQITRAEMSDFVLVRSVSTVLLPVVVLIASGLLSSDFKAVLVFWRRQHVLPGHRAFSLHGPADPRIDMDSLGRQLGGLPREPAEQNATWYRLYQTVQNESAVVDANRGYLLYRDMATISALSVVVLPIVLAVAGFDRAIALVAAAVLLTQFFLTAVAARNYGTRLIRSVLAVHAARATTAPRIQLR